MKIKDIYKGLPETIRSYENHTSLELCTDESLWVVNTNDIVTSTNNTVSCKWLQEPIVSKHKKDELTNKIQLQLGKDTWIKAFDSLEKWQKNHDISLAPKEAFLDKKKINLNNVFNKVGLFWFFSWIACYYHKIISFIKNCYNTSKYTKFWFPIFILFLCIIWLVVWAKVWVEHFTNSWYQRILSLTQTNNQVEKTLRLAENDFLIAKTLFTPFSIINSKKTQSAQHIIHGWRELSKLLKDISSLISSSKELSDNKWISWVMFSQLIYNNRLLLQDYEKRVWELKNIYNKVELPDSHKHLNPKFNTFKEWLKKLEYYLFTFNNNTANFLEILGHSKRKKYLIAFQNNDEIRPQWGFMWSLWMVEIFRGQIKEFTKKDVYFYEFILKKAQYEKQISPEWIHKLTPYLWLRDSNYYINLKDSWEKIQFFMRNAGHDIDGIIYLNKSLVNDILDITGSYYSDALKSEVHSNNFSLLMSLLVESKVSKTATLESPKWVLFEFIDELMAKIQTDNTPYFALAKSFWTKIQKREVILYSYDPRHRDVLRDLSLFQPIEYDKSLDFSYPVFTSISWNKSDRYIQRSYTKVVQKSGQCAYKTSLNINLTHTFNAWHESNTKTLMNQHNISIDKQAELLQIQWKWANKQYVRVIIPKDATVQNTNIVWVTDYYERGRSVDFYMDTPAWIQSSFTLNYILPNPDCQTYSYSFYKQPGIPNYNLSINYESSVTSYASQKADIFFNQ